MNIRLRSLFAALEERKEDKVRGNSMEYMTPNFTKDMIW